MPIPRPPEPFKTWLGRLLGSEEAADKERERICRRRALEEGDWRWFREKGNGRETPKVQTVRQAEATPRDQVPEVPQTPAIPETGPVGAAGRLIDRLAKRGYHLRIVQGKFKLNGPTPPEKWVAQAVSEHQAGLRKLLPNEPA